MAVLGLRFCAGAFSSCGERGPLFIAVRGPLTIAASLVAEHGLQTRRLSNCGSWAQLLRGMWDPPRPGLEPVCPALAGRLSTTAPPGKPPSLNTFTDTFYNLSSLQVRSLFLLLIFFSCETFVVTVTVPFSIPYRSLAKKITSCHWRPTVVFQMTWFFCLTFWVVIGFPVHTAQGFPQVLWCQRPLWIAPQLLEYQHSHSVNMFQVKTDSPVMWHPSIKGKDSWLLSVHLWPSSSSWREGPMTIFLVCV